MEVIIYILVILLIVIVPISTIIVIGKLANKHNKCK